MQKIVHDDFPSGGWIAVSLFVLQEHWKEIRESDPEMDKIILYGKQILSEISQEGFFARISWTTYFACINGEKTIIISKLEDVITKLIQMNKNCEFWVYGITELTTNPSRLYHDLEGKSYKAARESLGLKMSSETHCVYKA